MIKFSLSSKSELDVAIVMPRGYLTDTGAHQIKKASEEFIDRGFKKLIINFSSAELINTQAVSVFQSILQKAYESDCRVCFTNMNNLQLEIFELTGLMKRVAAFEDEDDAMIYLKKRSDF